MDKLLNEYVNKFNENFPIFIVRNLEDDEIMRLIREAIDKNEPYVPEIDESAIY